MSAVAVAPEPGARYRVRLGAHVLEITASSSGFAAFDAGVALRLAGHLPAAGTVIGTRLDTVVVPLETGGGVRRYSLRSRAGLFVRVEFQLECF